MFSINQQQTMKKAIFLLFLIAFNWISFAQELVFQKLDLSNDKALAAQMKELAQAIDTNEFSDLDHFKFQLIRENYQEAFQIINRKVAETPLNDRIYLDVYLHYVKAKLSKDFSKTFRETYGNYLRQSEDLHVINLDKTLILRDATDYYLSDFKNFYTNISTERLSVETATNLVKKYFLRTVYGSSREIIFDEIRHDHDRRYVINDSIVISTKDGAEVPVVVIRKRESATQKKAAILVASIYAGSNEPGAILAASKGYHGVISNTRGKRSSKGPIIPLEHEHSDVYEVIDWISKQSWSNQKVGMCGGSYNGFTQWASMKHKVHPALKTIVPMVSIAPGIEYPMENNVLHNFSYSWNFYVTNNKMLDFDAAWDYNRWNNLKTTWYKTGVAFNKLDSLDGEVNTLWNKYMAHPSYDDYWKQMIPYKEEFAKIDIPILTVTGYFDDSQRGAMYYFDQHNKYAKNPNHYLLMGPYDHWTAQTKPTERLSNYTLDASAVINIEEDVLYQWFDYILKGEKKPNILKDKVNFQIMGTDKWMHKPSLSEMTNDTLRFHISIANKKDVLSLVPEKNDSKVRLEVDFTDRSTMSNTEYYPWPNFERADINKNDGLIFTSDVLEEDVILNGSFFGSLEFTINKKDVDYSVILYQQTPEGKYFHLSYYIGRASYAKSIEEKELLSPNVKTNISFTNSRIISKKLEKGSRIVVVLNVNKNYNSQLNYGSGKDVNTESIKDAGEPLEIIFSGNSSISLPIWKE